jgi:hypothetical protein
MRTTIRIAGSLYVLQAIVGAAVGFALPWLNYLARWALNVACRIKARTAHRSEDWFLFQKNILDEILTHSVAETWVQTMDDDATIVLGHIFWRVKEKIAETYKNLAERMPDDDMISQTLVTLYEQGCTDPAELEDAVLTRLRPLRENAMQFI